MLHSSIRRIAVTVVMGVLAIVPVSIAGAPRDTLPGIIGQDDRALLDTTQWPWIAIGRVNRESGGFCTGTLVRPDVVVTAAHCLFDSRTGHRLAPQRLHFLPGYNRGDFRDHVRAHAIVTADASSGRSNTMDQLSGDWALLRLERPLTIKPIAVTTLTDDAFAQGALSQAGYQQDRAHILSLHRGCSLLGRAAGGRLMIHDCDVTRGGSGSPLLRITEDSASVVGVAVAATTQGGHQQGLAVPSEAFLDALSD